MFVSCFLFLLWFICWGIIMTVLYWVMWPFDHLYGGISVLFVWWRACVLETLHAMWSFFTNTSFDILSFWCCRLCIPQYASTSLVEHPFEIDVRAVCSFSTLIYMHIMCIFSLSMHVMRSCDDCLKCLCAVSHTVF